MIEFIKKHLFYNTFFISIEYSESIIKKINKKIKKTNCIFKRSDLQSQIMIHQIWISKYNLIKMLCLVNDNTEIISLFKLDIKDINKKIDEKRQALLIEKVKFEKQIISDKVKNF